MKTVKIDWSPTPRQREAIACPSRELLIGGGLGGGKSVTLCWKLFIHCLDFPGTVNALFRKKGSHLVNTTLRTWQRNIPNELYTINQQRGIITVLTGKKWNSEIVYGGLDSNEDTDKHSSAEYGMIAVDQAEEITEANYLAIAQRLRCKLPDGGNPFYQIVTSANPRNCYLRDRFILNPVASRRFVQILAKDNPYLPPDYLDAIRDLYKDRPEILRALIDGSWDILADDNVIIQLSEAQKATRVPDPMVFTDKIVVSCDPARFGKCETVIYGWVGSKIVRQVIYGQKDEGHTAAKCLEMANEIGANTIAVDECGIGGGVITILKMLIKGTDKQIMPINSARTDGIDKRYYNTRAEMWFESMGLFKGERVSIPDDPILCGQLAKITYSYNLGKIIVDDKTDVTPSPDRADACVMGLYALKRALPTTQTRDAERMRNTEAVINTFVLPSQNRENTGSYFDTEN